MIWAYMIYLGANMWNEADSLVRFNKNDPRYYTELYTSRDAWRKITDYVAETGFDTLLVDVGEGIQFETHPEVSCKGAWSKQEMAQEIERLKAKGITCVPKLNFASIHDAWLGQYGHMLSTPVYYKVVADLIDEMCELFKSPLFHVGFDEESRRQKHMQNTYGYSALRYGKTYWDDMNYCLSCVEKHGVRPWAWGGRVAFHPDEFFANASRDVIYSASNYSECLNLQYAPDYVQQAHGSARRLSEHGYDFILMTSTCYNYYSVDDSFAFFKQEAAPEHVLGYLTGPWYRTGDEDIYTHFAEAKLFKAARNKYYPEEAVK